MLLCFVVESIMIISRYKCISVYHDALRYYVGLIIMPPQFGRFWLENISFSCSHLALAVFIHHSLIHTHSCVKSFPQWIAKLKWTAILFTKSNGFYLAKCLFWDFCIVRFKTTGISQLLLQGLFVISTSTNYLTHL